MNLRPVSQYFESRAGLTTAWRRFVEFRVPGKFRARYVTTSMILFGFLVEAITGIFLWAAYSPSAQTAWESVYYIQHEMFLGWLVRGVHHYMTDVLIVVMVLDFVVLILTGAYRPPRELRYWLTLVSMFVIVATALAGYLLVWDQQNYWSSNVRTHLMTLAPGGTDLQAIVIGGAEYGHHTLTRFFAVHAGILPILYVVLSGIRGWAAYRQDVTRQSETSRHESTIYYWPHEPLKALMGCLAMLAVTLALTIHFDVSVLADPIAKGPFVGADLKPPADPSLQYPAARPEWYFLYLFQLLKFFPGESEFIGAIVIPTLVTAFVLLAPLWGRWKVGHWANVAGFAALGLVMILLSRMALQEDAKNADYHLAVEKADSDALRMHDLIQRRVALESGELSARGMISRDGAALLLRRDPLVQGPALFAKNCANCHTYYDPASPDSAAEGEPRFVRTIEGPLGPDGRPKTEPMLGGPNLFGFPSREWIRGLLDPARIAKEEFVAAEKKGQSLRVEAPYFGSTAHKDGRMATWVQQHIAPVGAEVHTDTPMLIDEQVEAIAAALSAEAGLAYQRDADGADKAQIEEGRRLIKSTCATHCHKFHDAGHVGLGPDLTGYGSYEWLVGMIADPSHPRFYGADNDRMPAFATDLAKAHNNALRWDEVATLADWLRRDFYRPEDEKPVDSSSPQQALTAATVALSSVERLPRVEDFADPQAGQVARAEALFERNCSACHAFTDEAGQGIAAKVVSAPNLQGFASRAWLADFLMPEQMKSARFFGKTAHAAGEMVEFAESSFVDMDDETKAAYDALVVALSAEAKLPSQADLDAQAEEAGTIEEGRTAIVEFPFGGGSCIDCHKFGDDGDVGSGAPDLTGYGSLDWLKRFVANPAAEEFYGEGNDRMPAFLREDHPDLSLLSDTDLELLLRWMRGELAPPSETAPAEAASDQSEPATE